MESKFLVKAGTTKTLQSNRGPDVECKVDTSICVIGSRQPFPTNILSIPVYGQKVTMLVVDRVIC